MTLSTFGKYKELVTGKRAREIIAVLWILSFVIGLIPFLGWNKKDEACPNITNQTHGNESSHSCDVSCFFEKVVDMSYMVYFNFFGCVLLPLLIMLGIYIKIFMVARTQLRQIEHKCINGDNSRRRLQKEINAAKSLSIIVGLFALCWLPLHILNCLNLFYKDFANKKPEFVMYVAIILSHANSVVNPIIYAYRIRDFRNTFHKIIYKHILCQKDELYKSTDGSMYNRNEIARNTTVLLL
ncbi:adenosine receptor A2b-like [Polyodon spathula]|uniref:adenosine receptor A2b-like n=1 Tax=Polyodon spathula TaxID=7913 RepID=UPI001B7DA005|nr:adenosine receptor A2b-like [Polyodon spathula]